MRDSGVGIGLVFKCRYLERTSINSIFAHIPSVEARSNSGNCPHLPSYSIAERAAKFVNRTNYVCAIMLLWHGSDSLGHTALAEIFFIAPRPNVFKLKTRS